jgi:transcriptional regulator with XRE-family HTH domain
VEASDVAKSFRDLVARTGTAKTRRIAARRTRELLTEMVLSEIREALGKTQSQMAKAAGMKQPSWAKLEGQSDMLISTLHKVMHAMGGQLELTVRFPQGRVRLKQFGLDRVVVSNIPGAIEVTAANNEARRPGRAS